MAKIEVGQFSTLLRRYLGMKGVSDVVDELAPEISPVFVLEAERPEWEFLKGQRLIGFGGAVPASPGQVGCVRFRNPPTSGMVAIFQTVDVGAASAASFAVTQGAQLADQATVTGTGNRDGRQTPIGGAIVASFGYAAAGGNSIGAGYTPAVSSFKTITRHNPVVVVPGFALAVTLAAVNIELTVSAQWIEKRLDDLEAR